MEFKESCLFKLSVVSWEVFCLVLKLKRGSRPRTPQGVPPPHFFAIGDIEGPAEELKSVDRACPTDSSQSWLMAAFFFFSPLAYFFSSVFVFPV